MSSAVLNFRQIQVACKLIGFSLCLGLFSILSTSVIATDLTAPLMAQAQPSEITNPVAKKLLGQWQVKEPSSGLMLTLIFTPDGKLFFLLSAPVSGRYAAFEAKYRINSQPQPMQIDLALPDDAYTPKTTIFEFTADGKLRLENANPGQSRPTAFTAKALLLNKISETTTLPPNTEVIKPDIEENRRQANIKRQSTAKVYIGSVNRAQQAYYLEHDKFATTIELLGLGIEPETNSYRYKIVPQGDSTQSVMITASAKLPELRSYIGAVFVINVRSDSITVRGICETDQPSLTPPAIPKPPSNPEGQIQCANGSHSIQR